MSDIEQRPPLDPLRTNLNRRVTREPQEAGMPFLGEQSLGQVFDDAVNINFFSKFGHLSDMPEGGQNISIDELLKDPLVREFPSMYSEVETWDQKAFIDEFVRDQKESRERLTSSMVGTASMFASDSIGPIEAVELAALLMRRVSPVSYLAAIPKSRFKRALVYGTTMGAQETYDASMDPYLGPETIFMASSFGAAVGAISKQRPDTSTFAFTQKLKEKAGIKTDEQKAQELKEFLNRFEDVKTQPNWADTTQGVPPEMAQSAMGARRKDDPDPANYDAGPGKQENPAGINLPDDEQLFEEASKAARGGKPINELKTDKANPLSVDDLEMPTPEKIGLIAYARRELNELRGATKSAGFGILNAFEKQQGMYRAMGIQVPPHSADAIRSGRQFIDALTPITRGLGNASSVVNKITADLYETSYFLQQNLAKTQRVVDEEVSAIRKELDNARIIADGIKDGLLGAAARQNVIKLEQKLAQAQAQAINTPRRQSVETRIKVRHVAAFYQANEDLNRVFLRYRGLAEDSMVKRSVSSGRAAIEDLRGHNSGKMTRADFLKEITRAMRRDDTHHIPEVQEAAQLIRKHVYGHAARQALKLSDEANPFISQNVRRRNELAKRKNLSREMQAQLDDLTQQIAETKARLGKEGYVNRVYRADAIEANRNGFKNILINHFVQRRGMKPTEASQKAEATIEQILRENVDMTINSADYSTSRALRERYLKDLPDEEIEDFLENDISELMRYYSRQTAADIELAAAFGGHTIDDMLAPLKKQASDLRKKYNEPGLDEKERNVILGTLLDIEKAVPDLEAGHALMRGTYGLPDDPTRLTSKAIRHAKSFTNMALLGKTIVSQLPDYVTPALSMGFQNTFGVAMKTMASGSFRRAFAMSAEQAKLTGTVSDMTAEVMVNLMSNSGDVFGRFSKLDRGVGRAENLFFTFGNLMAPHTYAAKTMASMYAQTNMRKVFTKIVDGKELTKREIAHLSRSGIDEKKAKFFNDFLDEFGEDVGGAFMANTDMWKLTDNLRKKHPKMTQAYVEEAQAQFRGMLSQAIDESVPMPGKGSKPLWMNKEVGGLLSMYMGFSYGATEKLLLSNMQLRDATFLSGIIALTGVGIIANGVSDVINGKQAFDSSLPEIVLDGLDRSGVAGIFGAYNNMLEYGVGYGARSMMGFMPKNPDPNYFTDPLGVAAGPAGAYAMNVVKALEGIATANPSAEQIRNALPWGQSIWVEAPLAAMR